MQVVVIGVGAGGASAAVELTLAGHDVVLWGRSADTVAPFQADGVRYEGVFGDGLVVPRLVTSDLGEATRDAEVAVVTLPTFAHANVARALASARWGRDRPVVLNPGHTGGALEFTASYRSVDPAVPPIVAFSTLAYVARKPTPGVVRVTGRAKALRAAALPDARHALPVAASLFPAAADTGDVLAGDLANVNMVLHPPGAVLGAAWVEATGGDFTFYVQGMTPGVARVMRALDDERLAVAAAYGHTLPNLIEEMQRIGTAPAEAPRDDYARAIASGEANRRIKAPDSLHHRYYTEDFGHGLVPFLAFAAIAGVAVPMARALLALGATAAGRPPQPQRDARAMGIEGLGRDELLRLVRG
jgi:opine dehydrogenase